MSEQQRQPQPVRPDKNAKVPYNAGDERQVEAKTRTAKLHIQRLQEGVRFIMSDPKGRTWMRHLIGDKLFTRVGANRPAAIFTGNSTTFYNTALKELGDLLSSEIATLAPAEFRLMEDEATQSTE